MGRVAMEIVIGQSQTHLLVDIQKSFGHAAFQLNASFTASAGFTILFGASGAGKSTVLDCIAGIVDPDAGRILAAETLFFDSSSRVNLPCQLRRVGYVFQDLALFPHMTLQANVSYGISAADAAQRSHALLSSFRIAHLASRKPREISGGERQRVALARALATDPRVLLLDEPLAGLDFPTRSGIIEDLRSWNLQHQKAILYVTHSRDEVFALGERVIVLEQGSMIADGTPHQVMAAPSQETVAQLAGFENIFDATVVARHEERGTMTCQVGNIQFETPLVRAEPGTKLRVGIRAGDILIANRRPEGLSAQNIFGGTLTHLRQRDVIMVAIVNCGLEVEVHLTLAARNSLALRAGSEVWLIVKTHSCHLMRTS
jgi:molybdate transport system ATP-binding protein